MNRFAEADAAHVEIAKVPMLSTTLEASAYNAALVLRRSSRAKND